MNNLLHRLRLMAQSVSSRRCTNPVAIGGIADIPQASRAHRCDALDPEPT